MNLGKNKMFILLIALTVLVGACNNSGDKTQPAEEQKTNAPDSKMETKDDCNCSRNDANGLASKIVREFEQSQNELESQYARVMRLDRLEQRPDCSWVATFEISWPFGNTDGMHPSEFIKKRFLCDGVEIYSQ